MEFFCPKCAERFFIAPQVTSVVIDNATYIRVICKPEYQVKHSHDTPQDEKL